MPTPHYEESKRGACAPRRHTDTRYASSARTGQSSGTMLQRGSKAPARRFTGSPIASAALRRKRAVRWWIASLRNDEGTTEAEAAARLIASAP